jgi:hypothetical protein
MPELSVLMPVYNSEATVLTAVRSTLLALPRDAELVVLDDGSSDASRAVLDELGDGDARMRVVGSATNLGVARGLQLLFQSSDSKYVARMDADDISMPWRFVAERWFLEAHGLDVVFSNVFYQTIGRVLIRPQRPVGISASAAPFHLVLGNPFAHSTMFGLRNSINETGGYRDVPSEDYDLWLRLAGSGGRMARQAVPSLIYRSHPNQVTASPDWIKESSTSSITKSAHSHLASSLLNFHQPVFEELRRTSFETSSFQVIEDFVSAIEASGQSLSAADRRNLARSTRKVHSKFVFSEKRMRS